MALERIRKKKLKLKLQEENEELRGWLWMKKVECCETSNKHKNNKIISFEKIEIKIDIDIKDILNKITSFATEKNDKSILHTSY